MINFYTKNIDTNRYTDIVCRTIMLNGSNGKHLSGYYAWENFKDNWELNIIPTTKQEEFKKFYEHLDIETSDGIAWGVTGKKVIYMFVNDSKNPFILRSNIMPLAHELLHSGQRQLSPRTIFDAVRGVHRRCEGAYAVVSVKNSSACSRSP